ncbi:MAG: Ada metal-binding domain-containing protein [Bacilli bacterium]|nr:Ada metal-binding domain-containing protein [Bacilli bacterium]MDD4607636.1 Ada metal-binding domain-containing protein [Bacilli bacterium]
MKKEELEKIICMSWSKETCYPPLQEEWSRENPSLGQCAITSLVVNDFFGGKIMRCLCNNISHYYNLVNNEIIDMTVDQFNGSIPNYENSTERTREYLLLNEDTKNRYKLLLVTIKNNFMKYGIKEYMLVNEKNMKYISRVPGTYGGHRKLKIYGKMDCPSALKWIEKGYYIKERVFFTDEETALGAGYRPCSICMPNEYTKWKSKSLSLNKKR